MSKKIIISIIIALLVIVGAVWYFSQPANPLTPDTSDLSASSSQQIDQNSDTSSTTPTNETSVSNTSNTDVSINQDLNGVDTQLNALGTDNATTDKGLNNPNQ